MTTARAAMVGWLDERLEAILRTPPMWGSNEAVEMQVLQLLEMRDAAENPTLARANPRRVLDRYALFLHLRYPGRRRPGHELAADGVAQLLREFADAFKSEFRSENPFEAHELAVRLTFKRERSTSANTVSSYIDGLRRAVRAVSRKGNKRAGKSIETATDYELEDLQLAPPNGAPAQATVCLGRSQGQADFEASSRVRDGFAKLVTVAEWAEGTSDLSALPLDDRGGVALQAQRLLPSAELDLVELGGKLMARTAPVVLRAAHRQRLLQVVKEDATETPFDETDEIRALDLDASSLSLGKARRDCSVPQELFARVTEVGVRARVRGTLVQPVARKAFVIVDSLDLQDP